VSTPNQHFIFERSTVTQEPFTLFLVHTYGAILIDTIFGGAGSPSTTMQPHQTIRQKSHYRRTMKTDRNTTIIFDIGVGVVSNLSLFAISLTVNHRNCFSVCHILFPFVLTSISYISALSSTNSRKKEKIFWHKICWEK
jgi:hypothetical protein